MAYRMQTSVPELTDLSDEPESTFELYGPDARKSGTFARNCLLARRLAERDVRSFNVSIEVGINTPAYLRESRLKRETSTSRRLHLCRI